MARMIADNFSLDVQKFMLARIERTVLRNVSEEYAEATKTYDELRNKLSSLLLEEDRQLLSDLDDTTGQLETYAMEVTYGRGFSDGIRFIMQAVAGGDA